MRDLKNKEKRLLYLQEKKIKSFEELHEQVQLEEFLKKAFNSVKNAVKPGIQKIGAITHQMRPAVSALAGAAAPVAAKALGPKWGALAGAGLGGISAATGGSADKKNVFRNFLKGNAAGAAHAIPGAGGAVSSLISSIPTDTGQKNNNQDQNNQNDGGGNSNQNLNQDQVDQMVMQWLQQNMG